MSIADILAAASPYLIVSAVTALVVGGIAYFTGYSDGAKTGTENATREVGKLVDEAWKRGFDAAMVVRKGDPEETGR